jgi:hypothetical protein
MDMSSIPLVNAKTSRPLRAGDLKEGSVYRIDLTTGAVHVKNKKARAATVNRRRAKLRRAP